MKIRIINTSMITKLLRAEGKNKKLLRRNNSQT
jgi:hypothetical protein